MTENKVSLRLLERFVTMRTFVWTIAVILALMTIHFNLTWNLNAIIERKVSKEDVIQMDSRTATAIREVEARVTEHIKSLETRVCDLEKKQDRNTENFNSKLDRIILQGKH